MGIEGSMEIGHIASHWLLTTHLSFVKKANLKLKNVQIFVLNLEYSISIVTIDHLYIYPFKKSTVSP